MFYFCVFGVLLHDLTKRMTTTCVNLGRVTENVQLGFFFTTYAKEVLMPSVIVSLVIFENLKSAAAEFD